MVAAFLVTVALWAAVIVTLEICAPPEVGTGFGVKVDAEVFEGSPLMVNVTGEIKPPAGVTVIVYTPWPLRFTASGLGEIEIENDPTEFTTSVAPMVWVIPPPIPWIVKG